MIANRLGIVLLLLVSQVYSNFGQNMQTIGEKPTIDMHGAFRLQSGFYGVSGANPRASRYHYSIFARPVLSLYGMRFPVTIIYHAQEARLTNPFNRFGASPYYKWAKFHLGHRAMRLSQYTLSGKTMLGAGVELTPGKLRVTALYGKLQNQLARRDTLVIGVQQLPTYDRIVYGGKIGYGSRSNHIDLIAVKVADDRASLIAGSQEFLPEASLASSLAWKLTIAKRLTFQGEIAGSVFTLDQDFENGFLSSDLDDRLKSLIVVNNSSRLSLAGDARLDLRLRYVSLGLRFKRIEPFYRSLGTLFYNSDYQDLRFTSRFNLVQGKLQLNANVGVREDNIRQLQSSTRRRFISSGSLSYSPSQKFHTHFSFSNFQLNEEPMIVDVGEEFRLATTNQMMNFSAQYTLVKPISKTSISTNLNRNQLQDRSIGLDAMSEYQSMGGRLAVNWQHQPTDLSVRPAINYQVFDFEHILQERYGLSLDVSKPFFTKKLRTTVGTTFNYNDADKLRNGHIIIGRLSSSYQLTKGQQLQLQMNYLRRKSVLSGDFSEWRSRLSYGLRF